MIATHSCAHVNVPARVSAPGAAAVLPVAELRTLPIAASLSFRTRHDDVVQTVGWDTAKGVATCSLAPWRTFRWYGQRHYSGTYWSATMQDHVIYESRLELTRLIYADFDPKVTSIVAQPFLIEAEVDGKMRRRIPDYLLLTSTGPVVVDVKPLARTTAPKVTYSLKWTRVPSRSWGGATKCGQSRRRSNSQTGASSPDTVMSVA